MTTLQQIRKVLIEKRPLLQNKGINEIGIFGSYIRGEESPESDIDILIDLSRPVKLDLFDLLNLEDELSRDLGTKVELVIKSNLKPNIGKNILSEVAVDSRR